MKNIYLIQNSLLSFDMDASKFYAPDKYNLHLIVNSFGLQKLQTRQQETCFNTIAVTDDFSFENLKAIISNQQDIQPAPLQIVTNAEEAISVCGQLRIFFQTDTLDFERFKNKLLMKELLHAKGLLTPKHIVFDKSLYQAQPLEYLNELTSSLRFPLIAKPIDAMGSVGIEKIESQEALHDWCNRAITQNEIYEIDEFIEGKVYNCDSYIKNHQIVLTQVSECSNSCYDFICGLTKGTIALPQEDPIYQLLNDYTAKVHEAMQMPAAGVTHLEVIMTADHELFFIEIGHRSPGVLIPAMYKKYLNIHTIESHIRLQIDDDFQLTANYGTYCAWVAFPTRKGTLKSKHIPQIKSEYQLEWFFEIGDKMRAPVAGRDYVGRALLWNTDFQQLKMDFDYLSNYSFYDIEEHAIQSDKSPCL